jgi:hypothetical protein
LLLGPVLGPVNPQFSFVRFALLVLFVWCVEFVSLLSLAFVFSIVVVVPVAPFLSLVGVSFLRCEIGLSIETFGCAFGIGFDESGLVLSFGCSFVREAPRLRTMVVT